MTSRLLLTRTVLVLVLGSLGGCADLSGADDAPTTAAETGEPSTAPPTNPHYPDDRHSDIADR